MYLNGQAIPHLDNFEINEINHATLPLIQDFVTSIIDRSGTPLLRTTAAGTLQIRERYSQNDQRLTGYVAISHVRSQGPWLDDADMLQRLQRMQHLVQQIPQPKTELLWFWLDTFCVPENDRREVAQGMILDIFQSASAVLALDDCWTSVSPKTVTEICANVSASSWMQRLWTIQEAAVGRDVFFAFADRLHSLDEVNSDMDLRHKVPHNAAVHERTFAADKASQNIDADRRLQQLAQLHLDLRAVFTSKAASFDLNELKTSRFSFRSLLRLGYLSMPRFRWLLDDVQYHMSQDVMGKISEVYEDMDMISHPMHRLKLIDDLDIPHFTIPTAGPNEILQ